MWKKVINKSKENKKKFNFPELGKVIEAKNIEEALKIATKK